MADWTDGPEYAPRERPDGFHAPAAEPLGQAVEAGVASRTPSGPPPGRPTFGEPAGAPPLAGLAAAGPPTRDPGAPFAVIATPLTTPPTAAPPPGTLQAPAPPAPAVPHASPWGAAHAPQSAPRAHDDWAPWQPLALPAAAPVGSPAPLPLHAQAPVNPPPFPTPEAEHWYAAYGQPPPRVTPPVTVSSLVDAIHPAVVACLAAGALAPWFGLGLFSAVLLVAGLLLALRYTRYRRGAVRTLFVSVGGGSLLLGALAALDSYDPLLIAFWEGWSGWAQLACWVLLIALPLLVGGALHRGEPPEP